MVANLSIVERERDFTGVEGTGAIVQHGRPPRIYIRVCRRATQSSLPDSLLERRTAAASQARTLEGSPERAAIWTCVPETHSKQLRTRHGASPVLFSGHRNQNRIEPQLDEPVEQRVCRTDNGLDLQISIFIASIGLRLLRWF